LGLNYVSEEFIKRGILTGSEDNCYTDISCYSEVNKKEQSLAIKKAENYTLTEAIKKKTEQ